MKERWFNYRPLCLVCAFLLLGSVFSFFITTHPVLTIISTIVVAASLVVIAILKKKQRYVLIPLIAFALGIGMYMIAVHSFNKTVDYTPSTIQARIYNITNEKDGMVVAYADSIEFDNENINDNLKIIIYDNDGLFENIAIGSIIKFKPFRFYKSDLFYNIIPDSRVYSEDLKYTTSVLFDDITYIGTDKTLAEIAKENIKENLSLGLTNENTEIAYSALFGDKDLLSDKQYNAYKLSGVAHLLAVSGLHVGIIVGILNWICKWFKIKRWYKLALIASFLLLYMHLCDYSVSIIRASIMSLVAIVAGIMKREYDPFNSIALAGIVIFFINPLCIFDVSFLLSFACVLGITILYMPIEKALSKTKMPHKIVKSVAISLSTTIAIVFIMAYFFRTLNIISIIANVVLIPIFTLAFEVTFVVSFISIAIPYVSYLLYPINYIFDFINIVATVLGNLAISNFNTITFNFIAIIIYFVLLLFLGRFCTARYQYKMITALPMVALLFYCLL